MPGLGRPRIDLSGGLDRWYAYLFWFSDWSEAVGGTKQNGNSTASGDIQFVLSQQQTGEPKYDIRPSARLGQAM